MRTLYKKAETTIDNHFGGTNVGSPDQWEFNLKKLVFLTYPELAKYKLLYSIKKQEDLSGIGTIAVISDKSYVTFPFVVKNEKAYPLDIVILPNGSIIPYDKNEVLRELMSPAPGTKTELPVTNQVITDVVGVPDFLKYRGGTIYGGITKSAENLILKLTSDAKELYKIARAYIDFSELTNTKQEKTAEAAVIIKTGRNRFNVKIASNDDIIEKTMDSTTLYKNNIEPPLSGYKIITKNTADITNLPEDYNILKEKTAEITFPATVVTLDSKLKIASGVVFPDIISAEGVPFKDMKLFVTDDGYSFNTKIAGVPLAQLTDQDLRLSTIDSVIKNKTNLHGVFVLNLNNKLVATEPVTITGYNTSGDTPQLTVQTASGKTIIIKLSDAVKTIIPRSNYVLAPSNIKFLPTKENLISPVASETKIKVASEEIQKNQSINLIYDKGNGRFSLSGASLKQFPIKSSEFLKEPDVALVLAQIGLSEDTIKNLISIAKSTGKVSFDAHKKVNKDVKVGKDGTAVSYSEVKKMSKIASMFGDAMALSTLAGLATPEGDLALNTFKSKLNDIRQDLAKLLLMSRLEILKVNPEKAKVLLDFYTKILHNVK